MVSAQNKSSDKEQLLLVKPFFMLGFFFFPFISSFCKIQHHLKNAVLSVKLLFCSVCFVGPLFLFPCCFAEVDV